MMHFNHCIILFVEERTCCIEVSKILSLNLELFGLHVKGLVGHRGMAPVVAYNNLYFDGNYVYIDFKHTLC